MTNVLLDLVLLLDFAVLGVLEIFDRRTPRRSGQPAPQGSAHLLRILLYFSMAVAMGLALYYVVSRPSQVRPADDGVPALFLVFGVGLLVMLAVRGARAYRALHRR